MLTLLLDIDTTVSGWEPDAKGTLERLRALVGRGWRPQDCELIDDYCGQIERWVITGTELLDKRPSVAACAVSALW